MNNQAAQTKDEGLNGKKIAAPCPTPCYARFLPHREPVAISAKAGAVNDGGKCVSAIVGTNSDLMENVSRLWIKDNDVIADVTFGRGVFWRALTQPTFCHDLRTGTDCRALPHDDQSIDVIVLDPPYRPAHGSKGFDGNGMQQAYQLGTLDTINDVLGLYRDAMAEAYRVLKGGGRIMVKCQDLSYANRLHLVTLDVLREMTECGFELADQFILVNTPNLASRAWKKQQRARRSHSVLWVGLRA